MIIIRKGQLNSSKFLSMDYCKLDYSEFQIITQRIDENYKCTNAEVERMRDFKFLDSMRHPDYPDDIQVLLVKENFKIEQVWVRSWKYTQDELFGQLLNEPDQNFGIHNGDIIGFAPVKSDDKIFCVFTGKHKSI